MLQFLKYVFATIVGLFLFGLISIFILIGIGSMMSNSDEKTTVSKNSVLKIDLNQIITENTPQEDPFTELLSGGRGPGKIGLPQIKEAIANAKLDPNIEGIYLHAEYPSAGFATLEEIRSYLEDFRKSKKFVYSYAEIMSEGSVYLSSVANKSYLT
ncbi:MAG TPA: signal peptide peptidase SppA, partial [Emticicia sp.]